MIEKFCGKCKYVQHYRNEAPCSTCEDCSNWEGVEMKEEINHPERYGGDTPYECIKVLKAWLSKEEYEGFLRGNAIKYICRLGKKDEKVQELKKARWYIDKLIESSSEYDKEDVEDLIRSFG